MTDKQLDRAVRLWVQQEQFILQTPDAMTSDTSFPEDASYEGDFPRAADMVAEVLEQQARRYREWAKGVRGASNRGSAIASATAYRIHTDYVDHLLTVLVEECLEVGQRGTKALRFTLEETEPGQEHSNAARIMQEYADLIAIVDMLRTTGALAVPPDFQKMINDKMLKVESYYQYSLKQKAGVHA